MKRKFLSVLLALTMVLSLSPVTTLAAEDVSGSEDAITVEEEDLVIDGGTITEITSSGVVEGNNITVSNSNLQWFAADNAVGRTQDGWWIGVKITAPSSVNSENVSSVKYINSATGDLTKSFANNRDGDFYINCWVLVSPEFLEQALADSTNILYTYRFDWDGDNSVDQTFTITVDPNNVTLNKDGTVYYQTVNGEFTYKNGGRRVIVIVQNEANTAVTDATITLTQEDAEVSDIKFEETNGVYVSYLADGEYTVSVKATGYSTSSDNAWTVSGENNSLTVTLAGLVIKSVTLNDATYTYSGSAQTPSTITVTLTDGTTADSSSYTVSYSVNEEAKNNSNASLNGEDKPVNAGTYTVTVTPTDSASYAGNATALFVINPKELADNMVSVIDCTYPDTNAIVAVTDNNTALVEDTDYTVKYSNNNTAGDATVTITGEGNYIGTIEKTYTISKASISGTISASVVVNSKAGSTGSVDLSGYISQYLAEEESLTYEVDNNSTATGSTFSVNDGMFTVVVGNADVTAESEEVTVTVTKFTNYDSATIKVTITYTSATVVTLSVAEDSSIVTSKEYDGSAVTADLSNLTITCGEEVTGLNDFIEYTWKSGEEELDSSPSEIGDYKLEISLNEDASVKDDEGNITSYAASPLTIAFSITKATRSVSVTEETAEMTVGDSLAVTSLLNDNASGDTPSYTVTSSDESIVSVTDNTTLSAVAVGEATIIISAVPETDHYKALTISEDSPLQVTVTVKAATVVTPAEPEEEEKDEEEEPTVETPEEVETPDSTSTAAPDVTVETDDLDAEQKEELVESLSTITVANTESENDVLSEELASDENQSAITELLEGVSDEDKADAIDALSEIGLEVTSADSVAPIVITYLEIAVSGYTAGTSTTSPILSMTIEPMMMVALTTAEIAKEASDNSDVKIEISGSNQNAVPLQDTATSFNVTVPVKISLQLPSFFVNEVKNNTVYIGHKTNNRSYQYRGALDDSVLTFTNPHGFSPFEFTTEANSAAWIGDVGYETLSAALDEVEDGDVIIVTDGSTTGSTSRTDMANITFVIVSADSPEVEKDEWIPLTGASITINSTKQTVGSDGSVTVKTSGSSNNSSGGSSNSSGSSGGSSSSTGGGYKVSIESVDGGKVTSSHSTATQGTKVTLTVKPEDGYELYSLVVTDKNGDEVELSKKSDNKYTFEMPSGKVTVTPKFVEIDTSTPVTSTFSDVSTSAYYFDAVEWAVAKGITTGKTANVFDPDGSCTRAQMVTFLWRYAGEPEPVNTASAFSDVSATSYYYNAVLWAVEQGITNGYDDGTFRPDNTVTRAQTVTFLYRYAGEPEVTASNSFSDVESGKYFTNAIQWAVWKGITTGYGDGTFKPYTNCTRAQIVTFMYRDFA